jgi:site-specific DNA-methyltransferase (adenine-specific)
MDPFCGCATTCVAAQQLLRHWIGIDIEKQAVKVLIQRLSDDAGLFKDFTATDQIPKRSDLKEILPSESVKQRLYKEQSQHSNDSAAKESCRALTNTAGGSLRKWQTKNRKE